MAKPGKFSSSLFRSRLTNCIDKASPLLRYPPAGLNTATKRPAASHVELPTSKKVRVASLGPQNPTTSGQITQGGALPAPRGLQVLPPKPFSAKSATNLNTVTFGAPRRNDAPGSESNKAAIEPGPHESAALVQNYHREPPRLSKPSPPPTVVASRRPTPSLVAQSPRRYLGQKPEDDWYNDIVPQPQVTKRGALTTARSDDNAPRPTSVSPRSRSAARTTTHERQPVVVDRNAAHRVTTEKRPLDERQADRISTHKPRADKRQADQVPAENPRADEWQGGQVSAHEPRINEQLANQAPVNKPRGDGPRAPGEKSRVDKRQDDIPPLNNT